MQTTIKIEKTVNIKRLVVSVPVRYGQEDMPNDAPGRKGDNWLAAIDVDTHTVIDWPQGETLSFYMKVTDQGSYLLFDEDGEQVMAIVQDYVPNEFLPGEYGDYLELDIDENGVITNWLSDANLSEFNKQDEG